MGLIGERRVEAQGQKLKIESQSLEMQEQRVQMHKQEGQHMGLIEERRVAEQEQKLKIESQRLEMQEIRMQSQVQKDDITRQIEQQKIDSQISNARLISSSVPFEFTLRNITAKLARDAVAMYFSPTVAVGVPNSRLTCTLAVDIQFTPGESYLGIYIRHCPSTVGQDGGVKFPLKIGGSAITLVDPLQTHGASSTGWHRIHPSWVISGIGYGVGWTKFVPNVRPFIDPATDSIVIKGVLNIAARDGQDEVARGFID